MSHDWAVVGTDNDGSVNIPVVVRFTRDDFYELASVIQFAVGGVDKETRERWEALGSKLLVCAEGLGE